LIISAVLSFGHAQDPDAHAQPLFEYETKPLTDKSLEELLDKAGASDNAHLFAFDDGTEASPGPNKHNCKAFPGDAEWPSEGTWKTFDNLLGGALINTVPIAAPCYRNLGVYDAEKCAAVRDSFRNPYLQ
jgi:hypothetical protein